METKFVGRREELASLEAWWTERTPRPGLVWGRRRVGKTLLLVIDEFPEVEPAVPDIVGILRVPRPGSGPDGPAHPVAMQLHPFRPHEAAEMLPRLRPGDRAAVYGIVGGMPLYLSWWQQDAPIRDNLMRLACTPDGRMLTQCDLVLATEAGQSEHMAALLQAIAAGRTRHNQIADDTRIDPTRTLRDLVTLRLVERVQPVTDTGRTRRRIYRIADNFLALYLGLLSPFRGEIERGLGKGVLNAVTSAVDDHMGPAYEEAFRDHLRLRAAAGELGRDDVVAIGPWWRDGGSEIDAVGLAGRGRVPFLAGEAKWSARVNAARIKATLIAKAAALTPEPESLCYVVCGREQVERADPETLTITAADIFA